MKEEAKMKSFDLKLNELGTAEDLTDLSVELTAKKHSAELWTNTYQASGKEGFKQTPPPPPPGPPTPQG